MMKKVKWGILSTASIAQRRVLPAMLDCVHAELAGIASRSLDKAKAVATVFSIPKAYGSYEELFDDPEIEAIYNPLPNHLHVEWSIRAASRGKHVLCEKPLSRSVAEARRLLGARDNYHVKIGEAFMVRTHPQWLRTVELVRSRTDRQASVCPWLFQLLSMSIPQTRATSQTVRAARSWTSAAIPLRRRVWSLGKSLCA